MKPYPVNFKYRSQFELMPCYMPQVLQDWLEEGWTVDITVRTTRSPRGRVRAMLVSIEASTSEDLEAKRRAFNTMIEAKGYGPAVMTK